MKDFIYTEILKEWGSEHTYIDLIDSIINILLYLLYHISIHLCNFLHLHLSLF